MTDTPPAVEPMALTDFLLARIAEDEAVARHAIAHERAILDVKPDWEVVYAWAMLLNRPNGAGGAGHNFQAGAPSPARVLAECEAKRRIVAECQQHERDVVPYGLSVMDSARIALERACRALAAVYSEHADFRTDWIP